MQIPGYKIIRKINSGGMASVYLAIQLSVGRTVALKIMKPALDQDPEFHRRFQREAEIIGQLSQPNIIPIYDIGRHEGFNYISMEYLPNGSLEQKIAAGITPDAALEIAKGIAAALEHAHAKGYVHRDIKPENILFRSDDTPVLTDFGIARTLKRKSTMTQVGAVIGTPYYMSPEQAKGLETDGRSDLYSLGVVIYEMLTGAKLFQAEDSLSLGIKHIQEPPPALPLRLFAWQGLLDKLLAKNPAQRFQQPRELLQALDQLADNHNPLQQAQHNTHSLQLLKAIAQLLFKDGRAFGRRFFSRCQHHLHKLFKTPIPEPELETLAQTQFSNAHTAVAAAPYVPVKSSWSQTRIYIGLGLVLLLSASLIHYLSPKPQTTTKGNWAALVNSDGSAPTIENAPAEQQPTLDQSAQPASTTKLLPLSISPQPANARVRILNIKEKYAPAMPLAAGNYRVEVSAPGYVTATDWIKLDASQQQFNFTLVKKSANNADFTSPELVYIAAANFLMGDASQADKKPLTKVFLHKNFYLSQFEITFDQYDYFAVATNRSLPEDEGWGRGQRPVINVSWDDAQAYVNWLSKTTGERYRLPTAAEWEFAARGNTTGSFWWGNNPQDAVGRANCRQGCKPFLSNIFSGLLAGSTEPVGSYPPNDWSLYDTAGNVAEWVADCHDGDSELQCKQRLVRGGSFMDEVADIASFAETAQLQNYADKSIGFRIAKDEAAPQNIFQKIFRTNPFK